jgi:hypothetical protein
MGIVGSFYMHILGQQEGAYCWNWKITIGGFV